MTEDPLATEVSALEMAWPGTHRLGIPGRALILIPALRMAGDWSPSMVDGLLIADEWPQNRPQLLIDASLMRNGQTPPNFSRQYLADRAWYSFSFNAQWDPARPHFVPTLRAWLRRFDGRP